MGSGQSEPTLGCNPRANLFKCPLPARVRRSLPKHSTRSAWVRYARVVQVNSGTHTHCTTKGRGGGAYGEIGANADADTVEAEDKVQDVLGQQMALTA